VLSEERTTPVVHAYCRPCQARRDHRAAVARRRRTRAQRVAALDQLIPPLYAGARLRHFRPEFRHELVRHWRQGIVLYGPTGTGKSYALCALLRALTLAGHCCTRTSWIRMCLETREAFVRDATVTELAVVRRYSQAPVLCIEDLGSDRPVGHEESAFALRLFYAVLDQRQERLLPTLISTNKTFGNIARSFDDRIASRLRLFRWLGVGGPDRRKGGPQ